MNKTLTTDQQELVKKEFAHISANYFNSAYFGPCPLRAKEKVETALKRELDPSFYPYSEWMGMADKIRGKMANLLNVPIDSLAHSTSTSDTINNIASGYPFQKGDVVAAIRGDYPSNVLPWMVCSRRRPEMSFELLDLKNEIIPTVDWLKKNLPKQTRIFNISHVQFDTGKRLDLIATGQLLKERNILFVVDATQALGGLSISPEELKWIDVLSVSSYKWMLGPYGHAFAYYSPKALELIQQSHGNWAVSSRSQNVNNLLDYTIETLPGAHKFDRGQPSNMLTLSCLEASLDFFSELPFQTIEKHNAALRDYFLKRYPSKKYNLITPQNAMGNILSLTANGIDSLALEKVLKEKNIDVSVRQSKLRISFHIFNTFEQVDLLLNAMDI